MSDSIFVQVNECLILSLSKSMNVCAKLVSLSHDLSSLQKYSWIKNLLVSVKVGSLGRLQQPVAKKVDRSLLKCSSSGIKNKMLNSTCLF